MHVEHTKFLLGGTARWDCFCVKEDWFLSEQDCSSLAQAIAGQAHAGWSCLSLESSCCCRLKWVSESVWMLNRRMIIQEALQPSTQYSAFLLSHSIQTYTPRGWQPGWSSRLNWLCCLLGLRAFPQRRFSWPLSRKIQPEKRTEIHLGYPLLAFDHNNIIEHIFFLLWSHAYSAVLGISGVQNSQDVW